MRNIYSSLGREYILQTKLNKERFGKRRKTQLKNMFNRNSENGNLNKPKYPNIKPINLDKKKVVKVNKLYPNLKVNKDLDNKSLNDEVYSLYGVKDNIKVIDDRNNNDSIIYFYNRKRKNLYPKLKKEKNVLLSFNEWVNNEI